MAWLPFFVVEISNIDASKTLSKGAGHFWRVVTMTQNFNMLQSLLVPWQNSVRRINFNNWDRVLSTRFYYYACVRERSSSFFFTDSPNTNYNRKNYIYNNIQKFNIQIKIMSLFCLFRFDLPRCWVILIVKNENRNDYMITKVITNAVRW